MKEQPRQAAATKPCAGDVLDSYLRALEAGEAPDREALLARHPDLAEELAAALDSLDFVHRAARDLGGAEDETPVGQPLGDYRLLREVGRGGMAVVYEAEQISLGRRVALKVLPFAAVLDPKQLQRFKNEALAAAHLRHPHIVPVYAVGCERGVHYYAMQFVEGQSLAHAVRDLKGGGGLGSSDDTRPGSAVEGPRTPISSHGSHREAAYIRMAATLGVEAAEALDHAHQLGIVHRDVKPGNLLVDAAGTLWVTDFGLARSVADVGLTVTGEILGTIRYMSPEQALAKRVPIDHRTDVYSLGATLYELFTLEPAFPGDDPHLVIQDIAFRDPAPPRRLNPGLPIDLETVLMKAMAKDPSARYATAQEMADDLKRYLEDRPVLARRPSLAARAARWARRHKGFVAASFVVLLSAIAILVADNLRVARALDRAEVSLDIARDAVDSFLFEAGVSAFEEQPLPSPARRKLLEEALAFYETYYRKNPAWLYERVTILHALHRHEEALSIFDRALESRPGDAGKLAGRGHMLWHLGRHEEALVALDLAIAIDPKGASAHFYRGSVLASLGRAEEALAARREAVRLRPDDAPSRDSLGCALAAKGELDAAILEHREAIRLKPDYLAAHYNLGVTLHHKGDLDGAILENRRTIRLWPDNVDARYNLGVLLAEKGDWYGSILENRDVIELRPDHPEAHNNLGRALAVTGNLRAAMPAFRKAIDLRPDYVEAHLNLARALFLEGDPDGAIREYGEAIRLKPDRADAHCHVGDVLASRGRFEDAVPWYRKGHELGSKLPGWAYPSGERLESAERNAEVEKRLTRMLSEGAQPRDNAERVKFAEILYAKALHADAVRMWAAAFAEAPSLAEDLEKGHRYNAACSAALAAARGGADGAGMRASALQWLRADLAAREKARSGIEATLKHWKADRDLAVVRDRLADLPAAERDEWTRLWSHVDATLAKATQPK